MSITIKENKLFPKRRDGQVGTSFTYGGSGGGGVSNATGGSGTGVLHNNLSGLEGGDSLYYYHLDETAYDFVQELTEAALVTAYGTPVANQVAIWNDADTIKGLAALTFDGSILYTTGNIGINVATPLGAVHIKKGNEWGYWNFGANLVIDGVRNNAIAFLDSASANPWALVNRCGATTSTFGLEFCTMPALGDTTTAPVSRFKMLTSGKIGIGVAETAPAAYLHIIGTTEQFRLGYNTTKYITFTVNSNGYMGINTAPTYFFDVNGIGRYVGNLYADANVGTTTFISGFAGSGWQITNSSSIYTLTVDNLVVRGALTAYELDINKINSVNGGIIISVANGTCISVSGSNIYFDEDGTAKQIQFAVGDYVRAQQYTGSGIGSYIGLVTGVTHSATYGSAYITCTTVSGTAWGGMELVQVGNTTTAARQNLIYITAADTNNPYIDVLAGVTTSSFSGCTKVRLGNLTGITDSVLGALSGYGLWSDNVYLSGTIALPSAGMTNEGSSATSIRIWAGDTYAYRTTAAFRVTQSGALTAIGIVELGTATALYGSEYTSNLAIKNADLWENSHPADDSSLYVNRIGYNGGNDYYRNFDIYDGKGYLLQRFDGKSSSIVTYSGIAYAPYAVTESMNIIDHPFYHIYEANPETTTSCTLTLPTAAQMPDLNYPGVGYAKTDNASIVFRFMNTTVDGSGILLTIASSKANIRIGSNNYDSITLYPGESVELYYQPDNNIWNEVGTSSSTNNISVRGTATIATLAATTMTLGGVTMRAATSHTSVIGTTDITGTGSEADMSSMSVSVTPKGSKIFVMFSAPFLFSANIQPLYVYINIAGSNVRTKYIRPYNNTVDLCLQHIATVTPGTAITVKVRWNATTSTSQQGSSDSERILTVIDLM